MDIDRNQAKSRVKVKAKAKAKKKDRFQSIAPNPSRHHWPNSNSLHATASIIPKNPDLITLKQRRETPSQHIRRSQQRHGRRDIPNRCLPRRNAEPDNRDHVDDRELERSKAIKPSDTFGSIEEITFSWARKGTKDSGLSRRHHLRRELSTKGWEEKKEKQKTEKKRNQEEERRIPWYLRMKDDLTWV